MVQNELINRIKLLIVQKGFVIIPICSNSMAPLIKKGDLIRICVLKDDPEVGDIIAYHKFDNHLTVHRIYDKVKSGQRTLYVTKGDGNVKNDPYLISKKNIVGIVSLFNSNEV